MRYGKAGRGTLPGVRGETQRSAVEVDASGGEARGRYSATTGGHVAPPGASAAPHAAARGQRSARRQRAGYNMMGTGPVRLGSKATLVCGGGEGCHYEQSLWRPLPTHVRESLYSEE